MITINLPIQRKSLAEKLKIEGDGKYPTWIVDTFRYYAENTDMFDSRKLEMKKYLDLMEGKVATGAYESVENPILTEESTYKKYPAKIRNYNIIKPIVERKLGERRERPDTTQVVALNPDFNELKDQKDMLFKQELSKRFTNVLKQRSILQGTEEQEQDFKEIEDSLLSSYNKRKARNGQTTIEILNQDLKLFDKLQKAYYYYTVAGEACTYKDVRNDDIYYEVLDPTTVTFFGWDDTVTVGEDCQAAFRRVRMNLSNIVSNFDLTDEQVARLEEIIADQRNSGARPITVDSYYVDNTGNTTTQSYEYPSDTFFVEDLAWVSQVQRGLLSYMDELGQIALLEVDEHYKLNKEAGDISIKWYWENEVWQCRCINLNLYGKNHDDCIFFDYRPTTVQRTEINNNNSVKLPFNCIRRGYGHGIDSDVKTGEPYNNLYNILHYRFELTLAKSKDKLLAFPLGLIPNQKGWDLDRWMYSINAFSILFFNEQSERASSAIQAIKEIDLSLSQFMMEMWKFMQEIKLEMWDAVGMNRQRYGQIAASDGKAVTEQALLQAAVADLESISLFESFKDVEYNGLIDFSKFAWISGKQGLYRNSLDQVVDYQIDGIEHLGTEYGVYTTSTVEEYKQLQALKSLLQPMLQNGLPSSIAAATIKAKNMAKVEELLDKGERLIQEHEQQMQASQKELTQMQIDAENARIKAEQELKLLIAREKNATEIEKALILSDSFNAKEGDSSGNSVPDSVDIVNRHNERMLAERKQNEVERSNQAKEALAQQKLKQDAAKAASSK